VDAIGADQYISAHPFAVVQQQGHLIGVLLKAHTASPNTDDAGRMFFQRPR
jgi:hypothetical protein